MSERSVNENNKLWEAAERVAEKVVAAKKAESEEERRKQKKRIVKLILLMTLIALIIVFASIAWFALNKMVGANTMAVEAADGGFEISVSNGNGQIGYSDLYSYIDDAGYKDYSGLVTDTGENQDTVRWRLTGSNTKDELRPGTQGELSFSIVSHGADINHLKYKLDLRCFTAATEMVDSTVDGKTVKVEHVTDLTEITSSTSSQDEKDGKTYLNSHIMFFTDRTGTTESNYQYSGFISDISNFELTLDSNNSATIYWIWPKTFGQIALNSSNQSDAAHLGNNISVLNSTGETNDRTAVTTYLKTKSIFRGNEISFFSGKIDDLYAHRAVPSDYSSEYTSLSAGYNAADLIIGKNVDYVLVMLTAIA